MEGRAAAAVISSLEWTIWKVEDSIISLSENIIFIKELNLNILIENKYILYMQPNARHSC
jgi:hypothetical protein